MTIHNYNVSKEDYPAQLGLLTSLTKLKVIKNVSLSVTNMYPPLYTLGSYEPIEYTNDMTYVIRLEMQWPTEYQ